MKKSDDSKSVHTSIAYWAIPRPWLIALATVMIAPWFGLAATWLRSVRPAYFNVGAVAPTKSASSGRWGDLSLVPIVISPPMELVFTDRRFMATPTWFFPGANAGMVSHMLQSAGVPASDSAGLLSRARSEPRISGIVLSPDPAWVRALPEQTRARIYNLLARSELNLDQNQAFRYPEKSFEEWLNPNLISPQTRRLIEPLIYRNDGYMLFSDIELVRSEIGDPEELRRLYKSLYQQPTVIARLSIGRESDLNALVEYWGRGGRSTQIKPLLESAAGGGPDRFIDVIHLLPPFAQNHLYCYPNRRDLENRLAANCLWTSLNFFLANPDDRYLDDEFALKTLKQDYFTVESDLAFGDVVAFIDERGALFHTAVYIADDLVFGKNGISLMAPWALMTFDEVKDCYRWRSEHSRMMFHRRKDL